MSVNYYVLNEKNQTEELLKKEAENSNLSEKQHEILASMIRFERDVERNPERFLVKPSMPFFILTSASEEIVPAEDLKASFSKFKTGISKERVVPKETRQELTEEIKKYLTAVDSKYESKYAGIVSRNLMNPVIGEDKAGTEAYLAEIGISDFPLIKEISTELYEKRELIWNPALSYKERAEKIEEYIDLKEELNYHVKKAIVSIARGEEYEPEKVIYKVSYMLKGRKVLGDEMAGSKSELIAKLGKDAGEVVITRVAEESIVKSIEEPIKSEVYEKSEREIRMETVNMQIDEGFKKCNTMEDFKSYLDTMAKFPTLSANNTMLIHEQMPEASMLLPLKKWNDDYGRSVNKGENSIRIMKPQKGYSWIREVQKNSNGQPMTTKDGKPVMRNIKKEYTYFVLAPVFDISQTKGKPVEQIVFDIDEESQELISTAISKITESKAIEDMDFARDVLMYVVPKHFGQKGDRLNFRYISTEVLHKEEGNIKPLMNMIQKDIKKAVEELTNILPKRKQTIMGEIEHVNAKELRKYLSETEKIDFSVYEVDCLVNVLRRAKKEIVITGGELAVADLTKGGEVIESTSIEMLIDEAIEESQEQYNEMVQEEEADSEELSNQQKQTDTLIDMGETMGYGWHRL